MQVGMVLSDEPGYYEDGKFGIRLENLVRVVKADTKYKFKVFLKKKYFHEKFEYL